MCTVCFEERSNRGGDGTFALSRPPSGAKSIVASARNFVRSLRRDRGTPASALAHRKWIPCLSTNIPRGYGAKGTLPPPPRFGRCPPPDPVWTRKRPFRVQRRTFLERDIASGKLSTSSSPRRRRCQPATSQHSCSSFQSGLGRSDLVHHEEQLRP